MATFGPFCEKGDLGTVTVSGDGEVVKIQVPEPIAWEINFAESTALTYTRVEGYNPFAPTDPGVFAYAIKAAGPVTWYSCGYTPYLESTVLGDVAPGAQISFSHPPNIYCGGSSFLNAPGTVSHQGQTFSVTNVGWVDAGFGYQLFPKTRSWTVRVFGDGAKTWEGVFLTEPTVQHQCSDCCPNQQALEAQMSRILSRLDHLK